jgi:hypothetical protein
MTADIAPVRLEISSREPAFGGESFGGFGPYERLAGVAHLRVDPMAAANQGVVDLDLAPRGADGLVACEVDLVILRPRDGRRARRVMLYDVVNRGMKTLSMLNGGRLDSGADPIDPGDGLLMRQGFTLVWSGWQGDVSGPGLVGARLPVATHGDSPVTARVCTEMVFDSADGDRIALPYPAADLGRDSARLTVRARPGEAPLDLAPADWTFEDERRIRLRRSPGADAGAIYRFEYVARDPKVMGLGFAATRDVIAFLRHGSAGEGNPLVDLADAPPERDGAGAAVNPDGGVFSTTVAFGASQSGRYLRDFLWQGFNRDLAGRRVFDGAIVHIAGARRTFTNVRFSDPGRFSRQHEDHDTPGFDFPFAYSSLADPHTGKVDGVLHACAADGTCPKLFHIDSSSEFWQAGASLVGTDGADRDVEFPTDVRAYLLAGAAHAPAMASEACRLPANGLDGAPVLRALILAMVEWTTGRREPPQSRWPRIAAGELSPPEDLRAPAAASLGLEWPRMANRPPPPRPGVEWPVLVPVVDDDGNEAAGLRLPEIAAPLGTHLGWNLRRAGYAPGDLCSVFGAFVPFAQDAAAKGEDPRAALAERYPSPADRDQRFAAAARALVAAGLLLDEDAAALCARNGCDG